MLLDGHGHFNWGISGVNGLAQEDRNIEGIEKFMEIVKETAYFKIKPVGNLSLCVPHKGGKQR